MKDKQLHRPSKADLPTEKVHPANAMGKRAKSGLKVNNPRAPGRMGSPDQAGVPSVTEKGKKGR
ncbi:MAG: hypothetical protein ACJ8GO_14690 [Ramlibacter sp.]